MGVIPRKIDSLTDRPGKVRESPDENNGIQAVSPPVRLPTPRSDLRSCFTREMDMTEIVLPGH